MNKKLSEIRLQGVPASSGIAIGKVFAYTPSPQEIPEIVLREDQVEREIAHYRAALDGVREDLRTLRFRLEKEGAIEGAAILDCHLQMLEDPMLTVEIEKRIEKRLKNSPFLFREVVGEYEAKFNEIGDPFFRERVADLMDVARRVLSRLQERQGPVLSGAPHGSIVFAEELAPSDTAEVEAGQIAAFVTRIGGGTSHMAIMAKARGIPYVADIDFSDVDMSGEVEVIVDGRIGEVILRPGDATRSKYQKLQQQIDDHYKRLERVGKYTAVTIEGYRVQVMANVEMIHEMELVHRSGGDGVGLFRSEYMCLAREVFPTEDEQYELYRQLTERAQGLPAVIRTFDVGGDKFTHLTNLPEGGRSMRVMLDEQEVLKSQLRAVLRASVHGDLRLLFPMITCVGELLEAKECLESVKAELRGKKKSFNEAIQVGCMIEVPSAAITADQLAAECDFFSIGTNDLVQYTMAVDRTTELSHEFCTPAHPSMVRLIKMVVTEASRFGVPVAICGEAAADPRFTSLLLGLGVQELSVSPPYLAVVKDVVRKTSIVNACQLAERVLQMGSSEEVMGALVEDYQENIVGAASATG